MRVYKIQDSYIDLDHVLAVSELEWWERYSETPDDAWFYITLAFQEKRMRIGFVYDVYDNDTENQRDVIRNKYEEFLKAWQSK